MEEITTTSIDTHNECQELKNIKYKTMLLNGVQIQETKSANDLFNLDKFLESEKNNNVNEPWCKLNKTLKTKKIQDFVEIYKTDNKLTEEESNILIDFLKECLDRKKLQRVKDVIYDKETGNIKQIPALCYVKSSKHFTLKNIDKRISTLKSLAPKKTGQGTIRKKEITQVIDCDSEEDDEN
jgi:hypothetical protein